MATDDIVQRAKEFAIQAHTTIVHLRKYTSAPYATHLENVVALVATVSDDPESLAAAWLHDVVEDTPVTIEDVEREFGRAVAGLVESLTDVSRPADGNRVERKHIDLVHLAHASPAAKTIKLADLIDNCRDICRNDERFALVYLKEMEALLEVLQEGDARLLHKAHRVHEDCSRTLTRSKPWARAALPTRQGPPTVGPVPPHTIRLFREAFIVQDVAEPVRSFDGDRSREDVLRLMQENELQVACIRHEGLVQGYVRREDLTTGRTEDHLRRFRPGQVLSGDDPLSELIRALTLHEHVFVTLIGEVSAVAGRESINSPVARMWLFGIITMTEMQLTQFLDELYPDEGWRTQVSEGRIARAETLRAERVRRGQHCRLLDCLQLSDKVQVIVERPEMLAFFGFDSKNASRKIFKELESLRNNLAHAQDIVTHDWAAIARIASRMEESALGHAAGGG
jgi:hypothetical protein